MSYKLRVLQALLVVRRPDLVGTEPRAEGALIYTANHPLVA